MRALHMKALKKKRAARKPFQYHSSLRPLFWLLLDAVISKRVEYDHTRKNDWLIRDIIETYSKETKAFEIGKTRITVAARKISLIFGIQSGTLPLPNISCTSKIHSPFVQRHFNDAKKLTKQVLEQSFEKAFKETTTTDFEDVARILCLYLCSSLFFANPLHSLKWGFVRCIEDLETAKDYAWSGAIRKALMISIHSVAAPERATGCIVLLLATQLELSPNEEERNFFPELELQDKEETQEDNPQQRESPMQEDESQGEDEEEQETQALDSQLPISLDKLSKEELHTNTSSLLKKYTDAQSRILQLSQENEELKEQNAQLCAENSNLKDEIMKLQDEKKSITSKLLVQIRQYEENNK
ncbi:hypothetical protein Vadar_004687 [Vaccinium darrowii]|uniref:Uncharacterized protein n=1 Tax=Vaccinium darrowii TaxID=229202 RepID=A0ACB7WY01_9ERIC|nr:hypothetical protein Vadar_004687 [Vaccinium darrowii]